MRVLHVIPSLSPKHGGPSAALPLIAQSLAISGVEVDVVTTDDDGPGERLNVPLGERAQKQYYGVFYFRKQTEFYKVSLPLARWVRAHVTDYDLIEVHALFSYASISAARTARRHGVPYVVRPLGVLNQWGVTNRRPLLKSLSLRLVEAPVMRHAAAMHYTSRQEQIEAEQSGACGPAFVLPLAIDTHSFEHLPSAGIFLSQFPQAAGRALILFLSRLDAKKGLELLLDAFAKLRLEQFDTTLVIAGNGEETYVASLRQRAAKLGIDSHIIWTGFLSGEVKLSALAAATLFVLPSHSENFGIALAEALSAGLACITTTGVAIGEEMREADAGVLVSPQVAELVKALEVLLGDAALRKRLGTNARRLAAERFSMEETGRALKQLYREIVNHKGTNTQRALGKCAP